ncbi:hypothetical protein M3Y94_01263500 [Aphelenchoides besseyi]|nr:hypothetical protein M3Y94_01263500 [Aphelenchoides besseyi]
MTIESLRIVKIDPTDYVHLLKQTATDVQFHHVYAAVKYHLEERLNDVQLTIYQIEDDKTKDNQFFGMLHLHLGDSLQIRNLGAVGAIHKETGVLACYEYLDGLGTISLLYCQPEHRSKGLATAVEKKICQTHLEKHGIRPFKGVSVNRPRVIAMSQQSALWTEVKAPDASSTDKNTRELYFCSVRSKLDKPKVVIYEN